MMAGAETLLEICNAIAADALRHGLRSKARIDLLFTMSDIRQSASSRRQTAKRCFADDE
jgi:hypothetical protein